LAEPEPEPELGEDSDCIIRMRGSARRIAERIQRGAQMAGTEDVHDLHAGRRTGSRQRGAGFGFDTAADASDVVPTGAWPDARAVSSAMSRRAGCLPMMPMRMCVLVPGVVGTVSAPKAHSRHSMRAS